MILEFEHVTGTDKGFALQDISFTLPEGYIMGLAGKNGAGKSTLMDYILNRKIRYTGTIRIGGVDIRDDHCTMYNKIGYVSDENSFIMDRTAEENSKVFGWCYDNWDEELFYDVMKRMQLSVRKEVGKYSRGEFLKFQTAFAMAHHASLYLIDEATVGMDPVFRIDYFKLLQEIIVNEEASILMISHMQDEIARKMDYVGIMEHGRLVKFGESMDVL